MPEVRLLYMETVGNEGFPAEMDPAADTITLAGLTMNGGNIAMGTNQITGLADGTAATDAVTLQQLQAVQNNVDYKESVVAATVSTDLSATFAAGGGAAGKGQFTGAPAALDGITLADGDRVLVKNQTAGLENGIYVVQTPTTTWDRALDHDDDVDVTEGNTVWVGEGTQSDTRWTLSTDDPITVNTTAQVWVQTAGVGTFTAGDGIDIAAGVVSVDLTATPGLEFSAGDLQVLVDPAGAILLQAAGISVNVGDGLEINTNAVAVDLSATPGLEFATGDLQVLVNPAGAIERVAAGIGVIVDGVTIQINGSNQLEVLSAGDAARVTNSLTAQENIAIGEPVSATTTNDEVARTDAATAASARRFIGIAKAAATATNPVDVCSDGLIAGALTGKGFTAGEPVFVASGGDLTDTRPSTTGDHVYYMGRAVNADDLMMQPQYFGRVS